MAISPRAGGRCAQRLALGEQRDALGKEPSALSLSMWSFAAWGSKSRDTSTFVAGTTRSSAASLRKSSSIGSVISALLPGLGAAARSRRSAVAASRRSLPPPTGASPLCREIGAWRAGAE